MADSYCYYFQIAGLILRIKSDHSLQVQPSFLPFLKEQGTADYTVSFRKIDSLPEFSEQVVHETNFYRVHPDGKGGYLKTFFDAPRGNDPYASGIYDFEQGTIQIDYLNKGARCVSEFQNCFAHLDLESLMLYRQRVCLHAACVDTYLGGILFSGPSGIGKSTQAELWCELRGARLINGDRPVLSYNDTQWLAWGSPYAGSSRCHLNENCRITAIVMLKQAAECSLRRLKMSEAFRSIYAELIIHAWDTEYVRKSCDLAECLVKDVPVFELSCTADANAVNCLEDGLRKELKI